MSPDETHLLIVDDNPTNIQLLGSLLGHQGYQISFAESGEQALRHLAQEACDLVLLDIMMPGLSGIEVCARMQEDPQLARIPVIFVTALHDQNTLIQAFAAGGVDYLTKPFIAQEMLARIQIHLRLRSSERRLRRLMAMRELIMSTLSHDLRGPVGTMASMLELMLRSPIPDERRDKMLENLMLSARRSYDLLEDLLTWSQAIGDELPFHPQPLTLRMLAQESLEFHRAQAEEKGLALQLEIPEQAMVQADLHLLRTILINLIGNAVKFTPAGGAVTLRCESGPESIRIEVLDTGIGVHANLAQQLERNQAIVSQAGTGGEKGTGMGLKICQEFAARHGGRLSISCRPEGGSCFALELPQAQL